MLDIGRLEQLMKEKGWKAPYVCSQLGASRVKIADWKRGRSTPTKSDISKLASLFEVSEDYLTGKSDERGTSQRSQVSKDDIMFALFKGADDITDEMYEEVQAFAEFVKQKHQKKSKE